MSQICRLCQSQRRGSFLFQRFSLFPDIERLAIKEPPFTHSLSLEKGRILHSLLHRLYILSSGLYIVQSLSNSLSPLNRVRKFASCCDLSFDEGDRARKFVCSDQLIRIWRRRRRPTTLEHKP